MAKIILVNEKDEILGYKERGTLNKEDIYRISALWIENSKEQVLLAQRKFTKKNDPGKWGPAVAGTNEEGETYESNIIKEAEEELGLKNPSLQKLFNKFHNGEHKHFTQWFLLQIDKPLSEFIIQEEEVEQIKWFDKKALLNLIEKSPAEFIPSIKEIIQ